MGSVRRHLGPALRFAPDDPGQSGPIQGCEVHLRASPPQTALYRRPAARIYGEGFKQENDMLKGMGGLGDMAKMMKAATDMQGKMAELQEELSNMTVTGESGAGLVRATATARGVLTGLEIDPSIFNPEEKEVVEDLILAAIKDAQNKATEKKKEEVTRVTEAMGLPKDIKLPF